MAYGHHTTKIGYTNSARPEKPQGVGPVTAAIRAMRNEPEPPAPRDPIAALRAGLERFFYGAGMPVDFDAEIPTLDQGGTL